MSDPDPGSGPRQRESTAWLDNHANLIERGALVVDLGCGIGDDALELARAGCRVVALDIAFDRLRQVPAMPGIELRIVGDLASGLPFRDGSFALVHASLSLHYFDSVTTMRAVHNVARVLGEGGRLLCRVNAAGDWNFGYGRGDEVEPGVFRQPDGQLKRFFTPAMLEHFLQPCFTLEGVEERTILQRGREKRILECVARKRPVC